MCLVYILQCSCLRLQHIPEQFSFPSEILFAFYDLLIKTAFIYALDVALSFFYLVLLIWLYQASVLSATKQCFCFKGYCIKHQFYQQPNDVFCFKGYCIKHQFYQQPNNTVFVSRVGNQSHLKNYLHSKLTKKKIPHSIMSLSYIHTFARAHTILIIDFLLFYFIWYIWKSFIDFEGVGF